MTETYLGTSDRLMTFGWYSLLPPLIAIFLAIVTRQVLFSLLVGILIGTCLLHDWQTDPNPLSAAASFCEDYLWSNLIAEDHLRVFSFTLLMGAMVGILRHGRGMHALVDCLAPLARSRVGVQLLTWLIGLIIFFDDYANTLLLGNTMRPLADRFHVSREKLAYLVDSTAAPVAGIALVSTWVATEIAFIQSGLRDVGVEDPAIGFQVFIASIPYRFYVIWALLFIPIVALLGREWGPMLLAEQTAATTGLLRTPVNSPISPQHEGSKQRQASSWDVIVPVAIVVMVTLTLIFKTGQSHLQAARLQENSSTSAISPQIGNPDFSWWDAFGTGDSYVGLVYGSLCGCAVAGLLARRRGISWQRVSTAGIAGARQVIPALAILWFAWTLSQLTDAEHLHTAHFVSGLFENSVAPAFLPTVVFILSSLVAFATGTSWGTMGILTPLAIRVMYNMVETAGEAIEPTSPLLLATVGSVLAGAIFGDHCSPISDTTVLSSQASGCDHISHVRTQMPYALLVGLITILCGTLPIGFGVPVWILLPIGLITLIFLMRFLGQRIVTDS